MTKRKPKKNKTKKITPKTPVVQTVQNTPPAEKIEKKDLHLENTCKVSVIVPVYNTEKHLRQCLDSIVNQTLKDIEIICVDDGSTDSSLSILNEYATKDKRVKVLTQKNLYAGVARNNGMKIAHGKYFVFWDSDDYFELDTLKAEFEECEKYNADICLCGAERFDDTTGKITKMPHALAVPSEVKIPFNSTSFNDIFYVTNPAPWNKMFSADFIRKLDLKFQSLKSANDVFFLFSALALAKKIVKVDEVFIHYRWGQNINLQSKIAENPDIACQAYLAVKNRLKSEPFWNDIEMSFCNYVLGSIFYNFDRLHGSEDGTQKLIESISNKYWHEFSFDSKKMESFKKPALYRELAKKVVPVPVYIHENSAYSKGKMPLVSIIIPAYNSQDYLAECIESAQKQTLKNIEIICVNDGSFDNSLKMMEDFAAKDKRITVISQKNKGQSAARNFAMNYVHGKYVLFLDSDDMIKNDTAEKLSKFSEKNNLDILFFDADSFFETKELEEKHAVFKDYYHGKEEIDEVLSGPDLFIQLRTNWDYRPSPCLQLIRTEHILQNGIKFYEGIIHEDNLFTFENILMAKKAAKKNWSFYLRRVHEDSTMTTKVSFRNVYGYLKTYEGMMCFTQSHHFSEAVENNIKYLVLAIKKHVYNDFNSLSAEEKKKSSTLSLSEQLWFESAMGSKTELGVSQLFTNFTNQVALVARIDIKNIGAENSGVEIVESDVDKTEFKEPAYMVTPTGRGKVIENNKGALNFKVRAINSGSLTFFLRGIDLRGPDGKRIPAKVTYTSLRINGEEQLKAEQTVWHDIPFKFAKNVKDGDTFDVSITWKKAPPESFALAAPVATVTPPAPKTIVVEKPIGDKKLSDEIATLNKKVADLQNQLKLKDGENEKIKKEALENCERILNMVKTCSVPKVAQNKNDDATVQKLKKEITRIKSSHRYRIGSVITFIPGSIRRWFKRGKK